MSVYNIAKEYDTKYRSVPYPEGPVKPKKEDFANNSQHGMALDKYEAELATFRDEKNAAAAEHGRIENEFKQSLGKDLGVGNHPKFDRLYSLAYQHGHSAGFSEIAIYAEEFADLLRD